MANASDTGEWKCILPVKGINEGYVNEYKLYNVSVVSCKNTYFFIYVPISIIFCMLVVVFGLCSVYSESLFAESSVKNIHCLFRFIKETFRIVSF